MSCNWNLPNPLQLTNPIDRISPSSPMMTTEIYEMMAKYAGYSTALSHLLFGNVGCSPPSPDFSVTAECSACSIELQPLVRIAQGPGGAQFLTVTKLKRTSDSVYFAAPIVDRSEIARFSYTGDFVGTTGTPGPGPGEIESFDRFFVLEDSVYIRELTGDIEVFDSSGRWVRTFRSPVPAFDLGAVNDSTFIVGTPGQIWLADRNGTPVQMISETATFNPQMPSSQYVETTPGGRIVSVSSDYEIESVSITDGVLSKRQHSLAALEGGGTFREPRFRARVSTVVASPRDEFLYVLISVRELQPPSRPTPTGEGEGPRMLSVTQAGERYRYFLDVVSTDDLSIKKRLAMPEGAFVGGFSGSNELYTVEGEEDGRYSMQVWRIQFTNFDGVVVQ